ncbi:MAG: ImpA family metalloprotease, partial [Pseudomonadota bacterium]|nr:ImpA family metalloprotease [Pseudomonadota bacterium]
SLAGSIWPVASDFANATSRYTHNLVHVLAGFKGPGIDVEPEIHDFVTARGLDVDTIDIVKHMNADQPTCGWGCSGNPYDAGWNFSPTGHGDLHELGHGIERGSMRFEGYGGHSNTNFYSYFSKSVYEDETGESASCQSLPFKELFNTLQQSKLDADPVAYMQANLTKSWSEHHAIYIQLMMAAQAHNTLNNGWFVYPRLHIWEREFYRADDSDSAWESKKDGLGFANYTRAEVASIARNDWLYISLSHITQLDLTKWFTMYGFTVSDKAQTQVKSNGFNELAEVFYTSDGTGYCSSLNQTELPVDGTQTWPHN